MAKKVLAESSGHGYWAEELVGPLEAPDAAGYRTEFVTPKGTRPAALPPSRDDKYIDPPLGRRVTTKEMADKVTAIRNKHVTGHCLEYDCKDGTGFLGTDFNMGSRPYLHEYIPRDVTAPEGVYHGNFGNEIPVIVNYPFITGRSTADSTTTGYKWVDMLENGLRRCGW
jgi:hypothetical protein